MGASKQTIRIESQNRSLADLERNYNNLEVRLEMQTQEQMATLERHERGWTDKFFQIARERKRGSTSPIGENPTVRASI